jgi:hypothetical protein
MRPFKVYECNRDFFESEGPPCAWQEDDDQYSPMELFEILGPSARACFEPRPRSGNGLSVDFDDLQPWELLCDLGKLVTALKTGNLSTLDQATIFHRFFYGSNTKANPVEAPSFSYVVPTSFLRSLLVEVFRRLKDVEQRELAEGLSPFPQIAWAFYEPMVINILASSATAFDCYLCGTQNPDQAAFRLRPESETLKVSLDVGGNRIDVPSKGFPYLDAFVVTEDGKRVVFLQRTTAQDDLDTEGIYKAIMLLPASSQMSTKWCFLFVVPDERARKLKQRRVGDPKRFKVLRGVDVSIGCVVLKTADASTSHILVSSQIVFRRDWHFMISLTRIHFIGRE